MNLKRLSKFASPFLGLLLFGVSLWAISHQLRQYNYRDILQSLAAIPRNQLLLALGLTLLNYMMLTVYDTLGVRYTRHKLPYGKTALAAAISYGITNSAGLELLTGSAIRYRLYSTWGLSAIDIAKVIAFCNLSFWLGLFAVSGVVLIVEPLAVPTLLHLPFSSVQPLGVIFLFLVGGYLLWHYRSKKSLKIGRWVIPHLSARLASVQVVAAALDWLIAGGVLYALLPISAHISFPGFFGIYILGQLAGVISNVPGGLGVFETVLLLSFSPQIPSSSLFGVLLAFRGVYYFLPLIVAVVLLGFYEFRWRLRPFRRKNNYLTNRRDAKGAKKEIGNLRPGKE